MEAHETKCSTYPYKPLFYSYGGGEPLNYVKNTFGYHHNMCQSPFVNSSSFKSEGEGDGGKGLFYMLRLHSTDTCMVYKRL